MNPETKLQNSVMLALSQAGCTIWRNETAGVWVGRPVHREGQLVTLANARMIQAGLCKGSCDLIGITPVTITPDMIGKTIGVFTAQEIKTRAGRTTQEQDRFIAAVRAAGGIAGVVRSPADALELLTQTGR